MSSITLPAEFTLPRRYISDKSGPVRWIWSHVSRYRLIMVIMVLGAVGNAALAGVVPVLTGNAFNAMLAARPDTSVLLPLALIIAGSQILRGILSSTQLRRGALAQRIERDIRDELYLSCSARA
jgi:ATP-binding cassette subfamily B protein